jgi:hypothetical protein
VKAVYFLVILGTKIVKIVNRVLAESESDIKKFTDEHNAYLKELGVDLLKSP